ncbi:MAG: addiction module antidote protein, HigA family [Sphingobacteriales bacterium]|nr:MAG: addiction module antidote protein, HigA family [Sphingobacteriales bacterium]
MSNKNLTPAMAIHPGEHLLDELVARNIKPSDFAKLLGMNKSQLSEIINGKRGINAEFAILLEKTLDIDASFWLNLQKNYELDLARIKQRDRERLEAIELWKMIKDEVAASYLKKMNLLIGDPIKDIPVIKEVYSISNFDQLASINANQNYARFRKSDKLKVDKVNVIGWVKLVEHRAKEQIVAPFNHNSKNDLIKRINTILSENKDVLNKVQKALNEEGIKIVYQEKAEKAPIDGVSFWSEGNPAVGMSLRHKRIDNFAFTLFHELGHIYQHLINNNEVEFIDLVKDDESYKQTKEEREADEFASRFLIPEDEWDGFFISNSNYSDAEILDFSAKANVNPAIVRGRICYLTKKYKSFTNIDYSIN